MAAQESTEKQESSRHSPQVDSGGLLADMPIRLHHAGPLMILLVDDQPERLLTWFWRLREQVDFQPARAENIQDAVERASRERVDGLVYFQAGPAAETWEKIRQFTAGSPETAVVVIHPGNDDAGAELAFQAGVQEYLTQSECSSRTLARTLRHSVLRMKHAANRESDILDGSQAIDAIQWELAVTAALSELNRPQNLAGATLPQISETVLKFARSLTGSDLGVTFVLDPERGSHTPFIQTTERAAGGFSQERREHPFAAYFHQGYPGLWGYALGLDEPFFTNHAHQHAAFPGTLDQKNEPVKNFLAAPVFLDGRKVGAITLANSERGFSHREQLAVHRLSETYALALQRILMIEELAQRDHQFAGLMDHTQDGIALVDTQGKVLAWNRALVNLSGVPTGRAVGQYCWEVLSAVASPDGVRELAEIQAGLRRRDPGSGRWEVKLTDAGERKAQVWLVIPSGWRW
jgi:PAS domain S-box-containing protein